MTEQTPESVLAGVPADERHFLIFIASHEERGRPWCRDCEAAEPIIAKSVKPQESTVVWVGSREEWNKDDNVWRQAPFNVYRVPTILKVEPGTGTVSERVSIARKVVEAEILEGKVLRAFLA
ncbi:hypothetical protein BCR35DRAFT_306015 [Leucosporidium creatinivorum]|uniref:Thioredoxin domain-containing protein n=1 Tax=Leucosporidium creatinivorum TaxID=106004 RepID=A0A1Y2EWN6_9BASI|nr:hypothetical protein BCR35DRAFT_306015 [Leucosporidium creatinivorum]